MAGLLGITVIGAILTARQGAALRAGHAPLDAFLSGYRLACSSRPSWSPPGAWLLTWASARRVAARQPQLETVPEQEVPGLV